MTDADCGLRERKKQQTRRDLHLAALELALEHGIEGTTIEAIAERVGVSTRTFFNYFPSKDAALVGADPDLPDRLAAAIEARPAEESLRSAIRAVVADHFRTLEENPQPWLLRRRLGAADEAYGARMLGSGVRIDKAVLRAALARARATSPQGSVDELAVMVEAYAALGAIRAAVHLHLESGMTEPLDRLFDRALGALPYPD